MHRQDYDGFWKALPDAALCRGEWDINEGFRHRYREEIIGVLNMLHRLGLVWGATALHPQPPEECDLCQATLADQRMFVDGVTDDSRWAVMCAKCFFEGGLAIGPLTGQLYLQVGPGKWRLVVTSDPQGEDETTLSLPKPLGFKARILRWLRSSAHRASRKRQREVHRVRTHCGTPHIYAGGHFAESDEAAICPGSVTSARPRIGLPQRLLSRAAGNGHR